MEEKRQSCHARDISRVSGDRNVDRNLDKVLPQVFLTKCHFLSFSTCYLQKQGYSIYSDKINNR